MPSLRSICICITLLLAVGTSLAQDSAAGEDASQQRFDLPAGKAERTLERFAVQSRQPVVFPTEIIRGVRTHTVKGDYTPFEALSRMLAGTKLMPVQDIRNGVLVVKPASLRSEHVVELPPYTVEGMQNSAPWYYAGLPGVEVLTRCSDKTTLLLINHHFRLRNTLTALLPEEFQVRLEVPTTYVLFDFLMQPDGARELTKELEKHKTAGAGSWIVNGMSNYSFAESDAVALFFILDERNFSQGRMTLTPEYFRFLMENRTPALPPWFVEGMNELYRTAELESIPPGFSNSQAARENPPLPDGVIGLRPVIWGSEEETQALKKEPLTEVEFLPFAELFAEPPVEDSDAARIARRRSQIALFIRWALDDGSKHSRREALWQFVRQSCQQPATEAQFKDCFGYGFAVAEPLLRDYLHTAIKRRCYLSTNTAYEPPVAKLREATDAEISRLKGMLDRMEITYVKAHCPELTPRYIAQARRTLRKAYDKGERDARLLAELGLCECDAGNDAAARPFLEAAVAGKVVRPRAYYELARIYYHEILTKAPDGKLTAAEAGRVLYPVAIARRQLPPLAEAYELIAEVWLRADARLSTAQLALLAEGIRNFPTHPRLLYSAALLNSVHGRGAEAHALTVRGLKHTTGLWERERFEKLKTALETNAGDPNTNPPATAQP